jgi:hypothetical protein
MMKIYHKFFQKGLGGQEIPGKLEFSRNSKEMGSFARPCYLLTNYKGDSTFLQNTHNFH